MAKYNVFYSPRYQKDRERAAKRGLDVSKLDEAIEALKSGEQMPRKYADHPLKGKWLGCRECHIGGPKSSWILIYQRFAEKLLIYLVRAGSHTDLKVGEN